MLHHHQQITIHTARWQTDKQCRHAEITVTWEKNYPEAAETQVPTEGDTEFY